MKKLLLALALVSLSSCGGEKQASDGYHFEPRTQLLSTRQIRVTLYPNRDALLREYSRHPNGRDMAPSESLMAFSVIGSQVCTIHALDPKISYEPEYLGHELTHCLYGSFHANQDLTK